MYTYCLILRWDSLNNDIVFTSYIVYFGFIFFACKFEKAKKSLKNKCYEIHNFLIGEICESGKLIGILVNM